MIAAFIIAIMLSTSSPAWAECAWVLWQEQRVPLVPPPPGGYARPAQEAGPYTFTWVIDSAYATEAACRAEVKRWDDKGAKRDGAYFVMKDGVTGMRLVCLPDTIDPRGPKGGGR